MALLQDFSGGGGYTTKLLLKQLEEDFDNNESYDLIIIAIGTNDIRYRNPDICAMTQEEYKNNIQKIMRVVRKGNNAMTILIAPWLSLDKDKLCAVGYAEKKNLFYEYSNELKSISQMEKDVWMLDLNPYIHECVSHSEADIYYMDYIHPNCNRGITLYSKAFIESLINNRFFKEWEKGQ